jgi:hypothetical protein
MQRHIPTNDFCVLSKIGLLSTSQTKMTAVKYIKKIENAAAFSTAFISPFAKGENLNSSMT